MLKPGPPPASPLERLGLFLDKIDPQPDGCWLWTGARVMGYGSFGIGNHRTDLAHRLAYELWVGPIPEGLTVDHTCHNADLTCREPDQCRHRLCVNPDHLEATTRGENVRRAWANDRHPRRTHCPHGHPMTEENTYRHGRNWDCKECVNERSRRYKAKRRAHPVAGGDLLDNGTQPC